MLILTCDIVFNLGYNIELTRHSTSQTTLSTDFNNYDIKYLPLPVHGDDPIRDLSTPIVSSPEDEDEKRLLNRYTNATNNDGSSDLQDIFCIPGPSDLPPFRSSSVSPSLGIDSGSALSSNVSTESGPSRRQHRQCRYQTGFARRIRLSSRRLSSATVEYVRYTLTDLKVGSKYR